MGLFFWEQKMTSPEKIDGGWIALYRKLLDHEIMHKPPLYLKVFIWLLLSAQYRDSGRLKRGQLITSIPEIQEAMSYYVGFRKCKPSYKQIRRIVDWLKHYKSETYSVHLNNRVRSLHERDTKVTMIETTNVTYKMIITICNYSKYQDVKKHEGHNEGHNEGHVKGTTGAQYNNNKDNKKEKKTPLSPSSNEDLDNSDISSSSFPLRSKDSDSPLSEKPESGSRAGSRAKDNGTPYKTIFDAWNDQHIVVHRNLTEKMKRQIRSACTEFTPDEIIKAIKNYAICLNGAEYKTSYRWTLQDFLPRGSRKYVDAAFPLENYKRDEPEEPDPNIHNKLFD